MCISEDDDAQQQREQRRAAAVVAVERHSHSALATTQGTHRRQWRFFLSFFSSQMDPCGHDDAIKRGTVGSNLFGNEIEIRIDGISLLHAIPFV